MDALTVFRNDSILCSAGTEGARYVLAMVGMSVDHPTPATLYVHSGLDSSEVISYCRWVHEMPLTIGDRVRFEFASVAAPSVPLESLRIESQPRNARATAIEACQGLALASKSEIYWPTLPAKLTLKQNRIEHVRLMPVFCHLSCTPRWNAHSPMHIMVTARAFYAERQTPDYADRLSCALAFGETLEVSIDD